MCVFNDMMHADLRYETQIFVLKIQIYVSMLIKCKDRYGTIFWNITWEKLFCILHEYTKRHFQRR